MALVDDVWKVDRSKWPRGPWNEEPEDRVEWIAANDVPCLAVRGDLGSWCGYVGLLPGHPWRDKAEVKFLSTSNPQQEFQVGYDNIPAECHGWLTYGVQKNCPIVGQAAFPHALWIGFDCGHYRDEVPGMLQFAGGRDYDAWYWTLKQVKEEVEGLALQVAAASAASAHDARDADKAQQAEQELAARRAEAKSYSQSKARE